MIRPPPQNFAIPYFSTLSNVHARREARSARCGTTSIWQKRQKQKMNQIGDDLATEKTPRLDTRLLMNTACKINMLEYGRQLN